jgi:excisionase family DNA binding protein
MSEMLSAKEAAQELGYHKDHLYRLLNDGTVRGQRISGVWLISRREIERVKRLQDEHGRLWKGQG